MPSHELIERAEARRVHNERTAEPHALELHAALEAWACDIENDDLQTKARDLADRMPKIGGKPHRYLKKYAATAGNASVVLSVRKSGELCAYLILLEDFVST